MPTFAERFLAAPARRRATSSLPPLRELAAEIVPERKKGAWEAIMDYLDLPGAAVRNVLTGRFGDAAQSIGAIALPGIVPQPEDRPDFGLIGNLATDPVLWFTGGGAGAARAVAGATRGLRGATASRTAAKALMGSATKAGREALRRPLDILSRPLGVRVARTADEAREAAKLAKELRGVTRIGRMAEEARATVPATGRLMAGDPLIQRLSKAGYLDLGGLKFGAPFREGRTVAFAGKEVNLLKGTPFYWAAKGAWRGATRLAPDFTKGLVENLRALGDKLYLGRSWTDAERGLAVIRNATTRRMVHEGVKEIENSLKGFTPDALQDFTQTLARRDIRGSGVLDAATFKAKYPSLPYDDALATYKASVDRMKEDLVSRGVWSEEVPAGIVQARHARAYPEEAAAIRKFNREGAKAAEETGEEFAPVAFGQDVEIPVLRKQRIERFESKAEAREFADLLKKENPDIARLVSVRRVPTGQRLKKVKPWEVMIRDSEEMVNLSSLKLHEDVAYFPQQYTDEVAEAMERHDFESDLGQLRREFDVPRGTGGTVQKGPRAVSSVFERIRRYDQPDFVEHVSELAAKAGGEVKDVQQLNIAELWAKRLSSHARRISNFDMIAKAKRLFRPSLRDPNPSLRITNAFSEWLEAGAGRLKQRTGFMKYLADFNRVAFKPFVTIGIGPIVNPAFHVRNAFSGWWQAAAHPDIGFLAGARHMGQILSDGVAAAAEKLGFKVSKNQMNRVLQGQAADAPMLVGGRAIPYTERQFAEMLAAQGVTRHAYVTSEQLVDALAPIKGLVKGSRPTKRALRFLFGTEFPGKVAQFVEDRMRATGFAHALSKGLHPDDAARVTREAFVDYEVVSELHRAIRDVVPFAQFDIGQIPRTIRTVTERPRVLAPLTAGLPAGGGLVPSWVGEQPHVPIGTDREGKPVYAVGAMTPFENINRLWAGDVGRTLERNIATTAPPLKAAYEQASGREPFFGTEMGTYRRDVPFARLLPDVVTGRRKRVVKTPEGEKEITEVSPGFLRSLSYLPVTRQISMFNTLFDKRKSVWMRSIGLLTGVKTVSVDEEKELRSLVGEYLKDKAKAGDVGQLQRFFAQGDVEPELAALLKAYYAKKPRSGGR